MDAIRFTQEMRALPEPATDRKPPYWEYWRHELWQKVAGGEDPFGFMGWPCIYHTMLVNHWPNMVDSEQRELGAAGGLWSIAGIGLPEKFYPGDNDNTLSGDGRPYSRNLIHQAYSFLQWYKHTGHHPSKMNAIVEFGGGYGAAALVAQRLGFRGRYYIIDLPEFALLQQFFLGNAGGNLDNISWESPIKPPEDFERADLLLGLFSLSESPTGLRTKFLRAWPSDGYLFLYSDYWEDYDNANWFGLKFAIKAQLPGGAYHIHSWRHPYLPGDCAYTAAWLATEEQV